MQRFKLVHQEARQRASRAVLEAPEGYEVVIQEARRSTAQNAAQWPILEAFAKQLKWPVNGELVYLEEAEWKDILSAAFRKEKARIAMGLDGGVVMLGQRTSKFKKKEFSEYLDFLHAVAAERGVDIGTKQDADKG